MATPTVEYSVALHREFAPGGTALLERLRDSLAADKWPDERATRVRVTRTRLFEAVRTLALVPAPSPALAHALWRAQQMLLILPADPDFPRPKYADAVSSALDDLLPHRVAAAAYTCTRERVDLDVLLQRMARAGEERAGSLRFAHGDRSLHDWPLSERPGWKRIRRLVEARQIGMLLVDSTDDLVPPVETRDPGWDRQKFKAWLTSWGIRLVCLANAAPAGGDAP
ncbi:hypothetical protein [Streptomyces sp. NPDC050485]|uniref:hypothetical protein n=1 Tax=Streptomyces sp. NPDC050485 TaxID=3365617 RepID=UPI003796CED5